MKPRWIVADVETTGLDPEVDKIVEVAWVELDDDLGFVPDTEFHSLINPERSIPCDAAGVNGVRNSVIEAENPPKINEITFPEGEVILICHNLKFDIEFLKNYMNIVDGMCTLVLSRRLIPGSPDYKLSTISCHCDLPPQISHRALSDTRDCANLMIFMCEELGWTLDQMLEYSKEKVLLKYCRVGKQWNGELWSNVDKGYLRWILKNDFDEDSMRAARYWIGK